MKSTPFRISASSLPHTRALVIAALAAAVGCASGMGEEEAPVPQQTRTVLRVGGYAPVEIFTEPGVGVRVLATEAELAWSVLGGVYAQLDIPVETSDPRTMQIGNLGYSARRVGGDRMNTFVDCGSDLSGSLANLFEITLTVTTKLTSKGGGRHRGADRGRRLGQAPRGERQSGPLPVARSARTADRSGGGGGAGDRVLAA